MISRRGTIISCLCALAVTAAGALWFNGGHMPYTIPAKVPEPIGSVSGSGDLANREAVGRQLLNAMPSLLGTQGRLVTLPQPGATHRVMSGSAMEMSKPLPPGILSPYQNTESTDRLIGFNQGQSAGGTSLTEEEEGGGVPPTTDVPVVSGEEQPAKPDTDPNPDEGTGQSSQIPPEESVPENPDSQAPSDVTDSSDASASSGMENPGEGQSSESVGGSEEASSSQSEESGVSQDASSQVEHTDVSREESSISSEESLLQEE